MTTETLTTLREIFDGPMPIALAFVAIWGIIKFILCLINALRYKHAEKLNGTIIDVKCSRGRNRNQNTSHLNWLIAKYTYRLQVDGKCVELSNTSVVPSMARNNIRTLIGKEKEVAYDRRRNKILPDWTFLIGYLIGCPFICFAAIITICYL